MGTLRIAASLAVLASSSLTAADHLPSPRAAALISAAVAVGDWRLHPIDDSALTLNITPALTLDVHGLRKNHNHLEAAAVGAALIGALLIASARDGNWCSGPRCDLGAAALLVAAPLLDAAAQGERAP
jgi:hypothetical protein